MPEECSVRFENEMFTVYELKRDNSETSGSRWDLFCLIYLYVLVCVCALFYVFVHTHIHTRTYVAVLQRASPARPLSCLVFLCVFFLFSVSFPFSFSLSLSCSFLSCVVCLFCLLSLFGGWGPVRRTQFPVLDYFVINGRSHICLLLPCCCAELSSSDHGASSWFPILPRHQFVVSYPQREVAGLCEK